jgi:hypothetical protein
MRFLAPAAAAGLIWCVVPAAAQTAVEPAATPVIPGVPAGSPHVGRWRVAFSPYALHFSGDSSHKPVVLFGLERERADGIVLGGTVFSNSFGQPSAYVYGGQRLYRWSPWDPLYAEWSAGLLYGYVGQYKDKVPLNYKGFSPGITAGIGWQFNPTVAGEIHLLGNSGLLFSVSVDLP